MAASSLPSPELLCPDKWLKLRWLMPHKSKQVAADSLYRLSRLYILSQKAAGVFFLEGHHNKCQQIFRCSNPSLCPSSCKQLFPGRISKHKMCQGCFAGNVTPHRAAVATSLSIYSSGFPRIHLAADVGKIFQVSRIFCEPVVDVAVWAQRS